MFTRRSAILGWLLAPFGLKATKAAPASPGPIVAPFVINDVKYNADVIQGLRNLRCFLEELEREIETDGCMSGTFGWSRTPEIVPDTTGSQWQRLRHGRQITMHLNVTLGEPGSRT
jgi:hypothetical protein